MTSSLRELYQEVIIDHGRRPRNFAESPAANHIKEGYNPLCGDKITVYITEKSGVIEKVTFQGSGCAISMASASLMTEIIKGKSWAEAEQLFTHFHQLVTQENCSLTTERLGKLAVLGGVREFPARVKCATLAWHALMAAMQPATCVGWHPENQ
ncbi:MAG: SUF system NifU family Fe-S cluster assembly protein [Gammaproteobacteria bacterium]